MRVDPITSLDAIKEIKDMLAKKRNPRDHSLFVIGINTNLRASDLCNMKVGLVRNKEVGDSIVLKEVKTGKIRRITINKPVYKAIRAILRYRPYATDNDPLFLSRKHGKDGVPKSINEIRLWGLVDEWCRAVGLRGNYGSHTLRKTWGYHQRVTYNVDIPVLMTCFNHSSQEQTLAYLCIQPVVVKVVAVSIRQQAQLIRSCHAVAQG